jgi:hypothetical protein
LKKTGSFFETSVTNIPATRSNKTEDLNPEKNIFYFTQKPLVTGRGVSAVITANKGKDNAQANRTKQVEPLGDT